MFSVCEAKQKFLVPSQMNSVHLAGHKEGHGVMGCQNQIGPRFRLELLKKATNFISI